MQFWYRKTKATALPMIELVLFLLCTPYVARSTTVMAVFTPSLVTIGVDGMGTYTSAGTDTPTKACKAFFKDNTAYVASGHIPEGIKDTVLALGDWFAVSDDTLNMSALRVSIEEMKNRALMTDPVRAARYVPGGRLFTLTVARPSHGTIRFRVILRAWYEWRVMRPEQHNQGGQADSSCVVRAATSENFVT